MARYRSSRYGFESVFAWMALFIPLQIAKSLKRKRLIAEEKERKESYYAEGRKFREEQSAQQAKYLAINNQIVPKGTIHLTCPYCGSQNFDWNTGIQNSFHNIGLEHFCTVECQNAWHELDESDRDTLRRKLHERKCMYVRSQR